MIRLFSLIIACIALSNTLQAQIQFNIEYGGQWNEDGRWVEQMPDSGFILVGSTNTFSNGQMDIWLVRTDKYGNEVWRKSHGGIGYEFGNMVKPTPDGGFIIAGFTNTYGAGGNDGWLVKTNSSGSQEWAKTAGNSGTQEFEAVILTADGGYAALGIDDSQASDHYDMYLVKFDGSGNIQWERRIGGESYEIGNSIQQTADGGYILSGQTYSYGAGDGDFYLVKTDEDGHVEWEKTYAANGLQESHYVQITPDGGYIMAGDADSIPGMYGNTDVWLVRTDAAGDTLWTRLFGGNKKDGGKTVENTSDGGFIIGGITRSFNQINPNYYLVKTDSSGLLEWQVATYGTAHHDHGYRAIQTSDGGYAIIGFYRNASNFMNYGLVKLGPGGGVTKDISVDEISAPHDFVCRSNNVPLSVSLTNFGSTNENNIEVTLLIDNGTNVTVLKDTLPGALTPTTNQVLTFDQTYNFNVNGLYKITSYIGHRTSDISYTNDTSYLEINVLDPTNEPTTISGVNCAAGPMTLSAVPDVAATDSMFWYAGGTLVSSGRTYTTPSLSSTTTYHVQSVKGKGGMVGPVNNAIGGGSVSSNGYLKFDARVNFKLISVKVYATTTGNRIIQLRDAGGNVLQQKTVNLPVGESRVYLDFSVPPGNDFQLGLGAGSAGLFRNSSGAVFPYDISRVMEMYGTNSTGADTYYYFYDWYVFVPYENCGSNMTPVQAIIGSGATNALDVTKCGNGPVTLTANSNDVLSWYDAPSGGNLLATGPSYTTPSLSSTTTYYLQVGSCTTRTPVQAIISTQPAPPATADVTRCGVGTVTLNATASETIYWYDAPSNGVLLGTGNSFTTPHLDSTETYYVVAGSACPSTPVAVSAIINASAPPAVTGATACGPASVTLTATSPDPVGWYSTPSGGTLITTTYNFTTPILASPVTYYAQAMSSCPSPRVPVVANVIEIQQPAGTDGSRCGIGSVVISAQSLNPVTWWTDATGGTQLASGLTFTTPSISATTVYYAQAAASGCFSVRTPVTATVNVVTPPNVFPAAHCGPGSVTLTATASDSIFWFDDAVGGSLLGTGPAFTTPVLNTTTTYYAQAGGVCASQRVPVTATISTTSADPVVADSSRCGDGQVMLIASSADPVSWYDAPGGNIVGNGLTFTTPVISSTTTYYAVAGITGCLSNPVPATATILPMAADPVVTGDSNCGPAQLTLTATASDPVSWYMQPAGGSPLGTGSTYIDSFTVTTTLYAEAHDGTCSSNRIPATATIHPVPAPNIGPSSISIVSGQTITLDAGTGYTTYQWSTGATSQTINVNSPGIFHVTVTDANACQGSDTITVTLITSVENLALSSMIGVFPNPTEGKFEIRFSGTPRAFTLLMLDQSGRAVMSEKHDGKTIFNKTYSAGTFAAGMYYLRFITDEGTVIRPLIIK